MYHIVNPGACNIMQTCLLQRTAARSTRSRLTCLKHGLFRRRSRPVHVERKALRAVYSGTLGTTFRLSQSALTVSRRQTQAMAEEHPSSPVEDSPSAETASVVTLFYYTTWPQAALHYSLKGSSWRDAPFVQMSDSKWRTLSLVVDQDEAHRDDAPFLEFVVTDKDGLWDKPNQGGNYEIDGPGMYSIDRGSIESIFLKPVMIVSDLDGTMVGDNSATEDFKHFWSRHMAFTESTLVYNTGRSLDSFLQLLEDKKNCLEVPDVLISAVGTKIYNHHVGSWKEDQEWIEQLDEGWDVVVAKEAATSALQTVGSDNMHFRSEEEQNEHKVTCGIKKAVLDEVLKRIQERLDRTNVEANLISSGIGEWRFLDIVSKNAGKLEALNYVRMHYGFSEASTVACGDSGNDILMLSGRNLAIVVGNAQPDLMNWVKEQQSVNGQRLFLASRHEAHGILEGLKRFGFY